MYQFLIHTTGIKVEFEDDPVPAVGFYTNRRAFAPTTEEAFAKVLRDLDSDPKTSHIFQDALAAGLQPKTEIEEVSIVPWWKAVLPWKKHGLCLYPADEDEPND